MSDKFAGMVLDENVISLWHFEFDGGNFLGTLSKTPGGGMKYICRFRYYHGETPGPDSQDEKHWHGGVLKNNLSQSEVFNKLLESIVEMARSEHSTLNEIVMDETGVDGLLAKIKKLLPCSFMPKEAYEIEKRAAQNQPAGAVA